MSAPEFSSTLMETMRSLIRKTVTAVFWAALFKTVQTYSRHLKCQNANKRPKKLRLRNDRMQCCTCRLVQAFGQAAREYIIADSLRRTTFLFDQKLSFVQVCFQVALWVYCSTESPCTTTVAWPTASADLRGLCVKSCPKSMLSQAVWFRSMKVSKQTSSFQLAFSMHSTLPNQRTSQPCACSRANAQTPNEQPPAHQSPESFVWIMNFNAVSSLQPNIHTQKITYMSMKSPMSNPQTQTQISGLRRVALQQLY